MIEFDEMHTVYEHGHSKIELRSKFKVGLPPDPHVIDRVASPAPPLFLYLIPFPPPPPPPTSFHPSSIYRCITDSIGFLLFSSLLHSH